MPSALGIVASSRWASSKQSFADDFNRADGSLGANWTNLDSTYSMPTVASNRATGVSTAGWAGAIYATACDTNNNFAQATVVTWGGYPGVFCRDSSTTGSRNQYVFFRLGSADTMSLRKVISGSETSLGTWDASPLLTGGEVLKVSADGSTITGYVNGTNRVQVTDTAISTGKGVGFDGYDAGAARYDDWSGGDL